MEEELVNKNLTARQKLEVVVEQSPFEGRYLSRVEDVRPDRVVINVPMTGSLFVPITVNTAIKIRFIESNAVFEFVPKIIKRIETPYPMLYIEVPGVMTKKQLRKYVRVDVLINADYWSLDVEKLINPDIETPGRIRFKINRGIITNISGGGIILAVTEPLKKDDAIGLRFSLTAGYPVIDNLLGKTVRTTEVKENPGKYKYKTAVEFFSIDEKDREEIIKFVFDRQISLKKKGLI